MCENHNSFWIFFCTQNVYVNVQILLLSNYIIWPECTAPYLKSDGIGSSPSYKHELDKIKFLLHYC